MRLLLPVAGAVLIALIVSLIGGKQRIVGVVHVLVRLEYHQGCMTFRGLTLQLIGAVTAIASGQSVGREGPGTHLGAASGSLLAQGIGTPNNVVCTRTGISVSATTDQALDRLTSEGAEALYLYNANIPALSRIQGIVTRAALRSSYRY